MFGISPQHQLDLGLDSPHEPRVVWEQRKLGVIGDPLPRMLHEWDSKLLNQTCSDKVLERNRLTVGASLLFASARILSKPEATAVINLLRELEPDSEIGMHATVFCFVALTSRNHHTVVEALNGTHCSHFHIDVERRMWINKLIDEMGPKRPDENRAALLDPTMRLIGLPIAGWLCDRVKAVHPDRWKALSRTPSAELIAFVVEKVGHFTLSKLRNIMPAAIFECAQDAAMSQALTGGDLGKVIPDAQLNYFSRAAAQCEAFYMEAMEPFFGSMTALNGTNDHQFGFENPSISAAAVRNFLGGLLDKAKRALSIAELDDSPESLLLAVDAVSKFVFSALSAGSGIRPTKGGCDLRLDSLILEFGLGSLSDKAPDFSHAWRPFGYPPLCEELISELRNLLRRTYRRLVAGGMSKAQDCAVGEVTDPATAELDKSRFASAQTVIRAALSGAGPIFLASDGSTLRPLLPADLRRECEPGFDPYLLRHRFERRMRELGAPGIEVGVLSGRYVLGQPFGESSAESLLEFVARHRERMQALLISDGWISLNIPGENPLDFECQPNFQCIEAHQKRLEAARAEWKQSFIERSSLRSVSNGETKLTIDEAVRAAIACCLPAMEQPSPRDESSVDSGVIDGARKEQGAALLNRVAAGAVRAMKEISGPKGARTEARRLELAKHEAMRQLSALKKERPDLPLGEFKFKFQLVEAPPNILPDTLVATNLLLRGRRVLGERYPSNEITDVDLFVGELVAELGITCPRRLQQAVRGLLQSELMMEDYHALRARTPETSDQLPSLLAKARTFLVLPLVVDQMTTEAVKAAARDLRKAASLTLSGRPALAAIAAIQYLRSLPEKQLKTALKLRLPAVCELLFGIEALEWKRVEAVVRLSRPVLFAGPALFVSEPNLGCTLPVDRQRALITGRGNPGIALKSGLALKIKVNARPLRGRCLSDVEIQALVQCEAALERWEERPRRTPADDQIVIRELAAVRKDIKGSKILDSIIAWVCNLITRKKYDAFPEFEGEIDLDDLNEDELPCPSAEEGNVTSKRAYKDDRLRKSSVRRYLTEIATDLLAVAGHENPDHLCEDEFTQLYLRVLMRRPFRARQYSYQRLREFHHFAYRKQSIEWEVVEEELPEVLREPEASIITLAEFEFADRYLQACAELAKQTSDDFYSARVYEIGRVALVLMAYLTLRIGEVSRLRIQDVSELFGQAWVYVCNTPMGDVKSAAALRTLDGSMVPAHRLSIVTNWRKAEGERLAALGKGPETSLFSGVDGVGATAVESIIKVVKAALTAATGRPDARPHWLRHAATQALLAPTQINTDPLSNLIVSPSQQLRVVCPIIALAWTSQCVGHEQPSTSLRSYFHLQHITSSQLQSRQLASREHRYWAAKAGQEWGAFKAWKSRLCDADRLDSETLGNLWVLHQKCGSGIAVPPRAVSLPRLPKALPFKVSKRGAFGLREAVDFIVLAQQVEPEALRSRFELTAEEFVAAARCMARGFDQSGQWLVSTDRVNAMLEPSDRAAMKSDLKVEAQTLQAESVRAFVARLDQEQSSLLLGAARRGEIHAVLPHLFSRASAFASTAAQRIEELLRSVSTKKKLPAIRHRAALLIACMLSVTVSEKRIPGKARLTESHGRADGQFVWTDTLPWISG